MTAVSHEKGPGYEGTSVKVGLTDYSLAGVYGPVNVEPSRLYWPGILQLQVIFGRMISSENTR